MEQWRDRAWGEVAHLAGTTRSAAPNGAILWSGPSLLNGEPVAVVAVGFKRPTVNPKTGDLIQVYIVPVAESPHAAARSGRDVSVCGECPLRPSSDGGCYVTTQWGPSQVWKQAAAGKYISVDPAGGAVLLAGADVRLGAHGDPGAVPLEVWEQLVEHAHGWSGYTHHGAATPTNGERSSPSNGGLGW